MASLTAVPTLVRGREKSCVARPALYDVSVLINRSGVGATVAQPVCARPQAKTSPMAFRCVRIVDLMSELLRVSERSGRSTRSPAGEIYPDEAKWSRAVGCSPG